MADMRKKAPILPLKVPIQELSQRTPTINIQASILSSLRYHHPERSEAGWYPKNQTSIRLGVTISIKGRYSAKATNLQTIKLPPLLSPFPTIPTPPQRTAATPNTNPATPPNPTPTVFPPALLVLELCAALALGVAVIAPLPFAKLFVILPVPVPVVDGALVVVAFALDGPDVIVSDRLLEYAEQSSLPTLSTVRISFPTVHEASRHEAA